ncbi:MAG: TonB family protein [Prevotella sp.]|nr:TonB family protein [Prevotella sp.]
MTEFLIYDLKVAALIAVFYFCYRLLMERETMHRLNRIVLLSSILLSLVLPLCIITLHKTVVVEQTPVIDTSEVMVAEVAETAAEKTFPLLQPSILFAIFIIGLLSRLIYIANSYRLLRRMIKNSERHSLENGVTLAVVDLPVASFSWMRTIVLSRIDYEERNPSILAHERGHIRQHHSWDIVFVEVLTALQWFNPVVWLLRRDLRTIHEYEADASVLSTGSDMSQYIQLLMRKAMGTKASILANGINNSTIKKRIYMMLLNKSSRRNSLKLLAMLPVVGVTLALNAETVTDVVYTDPPQKQVPVKKGKKNSTINLGGNQTIKVVEQDKTDNTIVNWNVDEQQAEKQNPIIRIRNTKLNGENPMIIVDGKKVTDEDLQALPPESIASITVMKSEAAIKSYGEDAKDGVIIVNTKKHQEELDKESKQIDALDVCESMPQFPGGASNLMGYLQQNIRYPKESMEANKQGRVIVQFVIRKDGSITDAHVVKSVDSQLDAEALRVISAMPNWTPGTQNGKPVNVKYTVPITFRLQGNDKPKAEGNFTPAAEGSFIPTDFKSLTPEEIIKRLPGAEIDKDGKVTINGKPVKKILVDGKDVVTEGSLKDPINVKIDDSDIMRITTKAKN